ncbi:MAG: prolipoprotein diacylglyceryl transferase [Polyangiaceae bacterium]
MAGPLIPYIEAPEIPLSFLEYVPFLDKYIDAAHPPSIKPFGTLVALGVYVGSAITMARARERRLDTKLMSDFIFWVVAFGFVLSHVLDAIAYHPQRVMSDPLYLLKVWEGLSSYGGFIGAVVGAVAWRMIRGHKILEYIDITVSAFPVAWIFGRAGCAVVHDHPGALSNAWFAVQYPARTLQEGYAGRYDLGLIEMVLTIPLALACVWLWRRKPERPVGFYIGVTLTAYGPVRFFLDYLRVKPEDMVFGGAVDPRYAGLTPAQWACFLALGVGLFFLKQTWGKPYERTAVAEPDEPEGEEEQGQEGESTQKGDVEAEAGPKADDPPEEEGDEADEGEGQAPKPRKKKRRAKKKAAQEG